MTEEEISDEVGEVEPEPTEGLDAQPPAPSDEQQEDRLEVAP